MGGTLGALRSLSRRARGCVDDGGVCVCVGSAGGKGRGERRASERRVRGSRGSELQAVAIAMGGR